MLTAIVSLVYKSDPKSEQVIRVPLSDYSQFIKALCNKKKLVSYRLEYVTTVAAALNWPLTPLPWQPENKMENAMLCQIIITLAVAWYAGAAIIEKKPTKKPMATRKKEQGE